MTALIVVDMQVGLFESGKPRFDADGVIERINRVSETVRNIGGHVVYVQHDGRTGTQLEPNSIGWDLLPALSRVPSDRIIHKKASDSFYGSNLGKLLDRLGAKRLIIAGCATDFCVDTTVRSAASKGYQVIALEDGHTTRDRTHLDAESIIKHHNWMWKNLILAEGHIKVLPAERLIQGLSL